MGVALNKGRIFPIKYCTAMFQIILHRLSISSRMQSPDTSVEETKIERRSMCVEEQTCKFGVASIDTEKQR